MTLAASPEQLDHIGQLAAAMIQDGQRVGLGSGKAALAFVRALGARVRREKIRVVGVPTSIETHHLADSLGIPLGSLLEVESLDITVDGADEVDPQLNLIKGGGGYLTREKVVAGITRRFIIVVGGEKLVDRLGTRFPAFVECIEFARPVVTRQLEKMGAKVTARLNPDGSAYMTDNGNPYLLARFDPAVLSRDPAGIDLAIRRLPGVVETGLFIGMAQEVLVAHADGKVEHKRR